MRSQEKIKCFPRTVSRDNSNPRLWNIHPVSPNETLGLVK
jgi:hypothetical protein